MSGTETEIEVEETCWCTITILMSIIIAAFSYRFFGPENPESSKKPETNQEVYVQVHSSHCRCYSVDCINYKRAEKWCSCF